jgi:hypothetical protein
VTTERSDDREKRRELGTAIPAADDRDTVDPLRKV